MRKRAGGRGREGERARGRVAAWGRKRERTRKQSRGRRRAGEKVRATEQARTGKAAFFKKTQTHSIFTHLGRFKLLVHPGQLCFQLATFYCKRCFGPFDLARPVGVWKGGRREQKVRRRNFCCVNLTTRKRNGSGSPSAVSTACFPACCPHLWFIVSPNLGQRNTNARHGYFFV